MIIFSEEDDSEDEVFLDEPIEQNSEGIGHYLFIATIGQGTFGEVKIGIDNLHLYYLI